MPAGLERGRSGAGRWSRVQERGRSAAGWLRGREAGRGSSGAEEMGGRAAGPPRVCWAPSRVRRVWRCLRVVWARSVARAARRVPACAWQVLLVTRLDVRDSPRDWGCWSLFCPCGKVLCRASQGQEEIAEGTLEMPAGRIALHPGPGTHREAESRDGNPICARWSSETCCGRAGSPADPRRPASLQIGALPSGFENPARLPVWG